MVFVKVVFLVNIVEKCLRKGKAWHAKEPLQLIHSDICGPLEVPSLSRPIYFLTFIDDFSRKSWVYFLKNKSEVFSIFQIFKSFVENEFGKKIKNLRLDNGGNLLRINLKHFYPNMVFNTKILYLTHQQNGVTKRRNRTLVEMATCMLYSKGLHKKIWAEAITYANFILNQDKTC